MNVVLGPERLRLVQGEGGGVVRDHATVAEGETVALEDLKVAGRSRGGADGAPRGLLTEALGADLGEG